MNQSAKTTLRFIFQEFRDILILVAISTIATYMFAGNRIFTNFNIYSRSIFYGFCVGWTIWKGNQLLGWLLDKKYPWNVKPVFALTVHLGSSIIFTIIDICIVNYLIYKYIFHTNLLDDWNRFLSYAVAQFVIAMLVTIIFYVKHYFDSWRELVIKEEEFKRETLALRYESLKSYVNPHFLFNSLSVLSSLVEKDVAKSQEFIKQLSDTYRYVIEQKDKELVALDVEIQFVLSYINLHKIRHGENLKVELNIQNRNGFIIPLSLQILLENAFKHNIISVDEPLDVKIWREGDYLIVQNKLQVRRTISESNGIGLDTISKSYQFFTKQPLVVLKENGFFTVKIPILYL